MNIPVTFAAERPGRVPPLSPDRGRYESRSAASSFPTSRGGTPAALRAWRCLAARRELSPLPRSIFDTRPGRGDPRQGVATRRTSASSRVAARGPDEYQPLAHCSGPALASVSGTT